MRRTGLLRRMVEIVLWVTVVSVPVVASDAPSLVLHNSVVIAMTTLGDVREAIAVRGDRILAVGTNEEILALAGLETRVIDLAGRTVLPGFIDAHAHLLRDCGSADLTIEEAQALAVSLGITTAAEMLVEPDDVERYVKAAERGEICVRTCLFLTCNGLCGNVYGPWYTGYTPLVEIAPRLSIGGVKIFVERSSCGALRPSISFSEELRVRLSPAGSVWYGEDRPLFSVDELAGVVRSAAEAGFPVAMHAIGDEAVETALLALLAAGPAAAELRPLLLHNLFVRDDLLPLYGEASAVPVVEPVNACFVDAYDDMLPPAYASVVRRIGDLANVVRATAAGSDWPWGDPGSLSPLFRLANLVSPANASPVYASWEPCEPLSASQTVSVWRALRMITAEAAYALHVEDELGTVESGKVADLVVLSANPLALPVDRLASVRVEMTIVDGRIAWQVGDTAPGPSP